jgi:hypothetical protein
MSKDNKLKWKAMARTRQLPHEGTGSVMIEIVL